MKYLISQKEKFISKYPSSHFSYNFKTSWNWFIERWELRTSKGLNFGFDCMFFGFEAYISQAQITKLMVADVKSVFLYWGENEI